MIDAIVAEPSGGAHRDHEKAARLLDDAISEELEWLQTIRRRSDAALRRRKFREMGAWVE